VLLFQNTSTRFRISIKTKDAGTSGRPLQFALGPGENRKIMEQELKGYGAGVRMDLAEYMQKKILGISEVDSVHLVDAFGAKVMATVPLNAVNPAPFLPTEKTIEIGSDYLILQPEPVAIDRLITACIAFKEAYFDHLLDVRVHSVAGTIPAVTDPTDVASALVFLAAIQADFNLHIADGALHPTVDSTSVCSALFTPATLLTANAALAELLGNYAGHKVMGYDSVNPPLTPVTVMTY
jgi:hypothetical protein